MRRDVRKGRTLMANRAGSLLGTCRSGAWQRQVSVEGCSAGSGYLARSTAAASRFRGLGRACGIATARSERCSAQAGADTSCDSRGSSRATNWNRVWPARVLRSN